MNLTGKLNPTQQLSGGLNPELSMAGFLTYAGNNAPYIGDNGNWYVWDVTQGTYADTGIAAQKEGPPGPPGVSVTVGTTVTAEPGTPASVTNTGTPSDPVLNFTIPSGQDGAPGADGAGVPDGGTTGQVLAKASASNKDTHWVDPPASDESMPLLPTDTQADLPLVSNANRGAQTKTAAEMRGILGVEPALTSSVTYYVSTTGSDASGDGSSANPWASVNYALSKIPKNLGGYVATINIAAGTYAQLLYVSGFFNGVLNITGEYTVANTCAVIFSLSGSLVARIINCLCIVEISYIQIDTTTVRGLQINNCYNVSLLGLHVNGNSTTWNIASDGSNLYIVYTSTAWRVTSNSGLYGVMMVNGSLHAYMPIVGSGNTYGIGCQAAIADGDGFPSGTTATLTTRGGRVFTGSQA